MAPWQVSRTKICACSFCVAVKATNLPSALTVGVASPTVRTAAAGRALAAGHVAAIEKDNLVGLVPPPPFPLPACAAGGLKTLTFAVVAVATRALSTVAWIWVALLTLFPLNVVCVPPALHNTCEA